MNLSDDSRSFLVTGTILKSEKYQYEILCPVGVGGTSVVYRGKISDGPDADTIVIIKELFPFDSDIVSFKRNSDGSLIIKDNDSMNAYKTIEKETFELAKGLISNKEHNSPHAWHYRDFIGNLNNTVYTICYEVSGFTLEDGIKKGIIPSTTLADCVQIILNILPALEIVHSAGKVHCDIKPSNIWVVDSRPHFHYRLLDFGSAVSVGKEQRIISSTYDYAAPEIPFSISSRSSGGGNENNNSSPKLNRDSLINVTPAIDIYSVVAILYQLVTGKTARERKIDESIGRTDGIIFNVSDEALDLLNGLFRNGFSLKPEARPILPKIQENLQELLEMLQELRDTIFLKTFSAGDFVPWVVPPTISNPLSTKSLPKMLSRPLCYLSTFGKGGADYYYAAALVAGFCKKKVKKARLLPIAYVDSLEETLSLLPFGSSRNHFNQDDRLSALQSLTENYYIIILGYRDSDSNQRLLDRIARSMGFKAHFVLCGKMPSQKEIERYRRGSETTLTIEVPDIEMTTSTHPALHYVFICKKTVRRDNFDDITDLGLHQSFLTSLPGINDEDLDTLCCSRILYCLGNTYYYNPILRFQLQRYWGADEKALETVLQSILDISRTPDYYAQNRQSMTLPDFRLFAVLFSQLPCTERKCHILSDLYTQIAEVSLHSRMIDLYEEHFNQFITNVPNRLHLLSDNLFELARYIKGSDIRENVLNQFRNILFAVAKDIHFALEIDMNNKHYSSAIEKCVLLIEIYNFYGEYFAKTVADLYATMARAYNNKGMCPQALASITQAIEFTSGNSSDWRSYRFMQYRGLIHTKMCNFEHALSDYSKVLETICTDAYVWYERGFVYSLLGKNDEALSDYTKAIELEPTNGIYWCGRGHKYEHIGKNEKALYDFSVAIKLEPSDVHNWLSRGSLYESLGKTDEALSDYLKAIEIDPNYTPSWYYCTNLYYHTIGDYTKALNVISKVIEIDPSDYRAWEYRGIIYNKLGENEKALNDLSKAIDLNPTKEFYKQRGAIYDKIGEREKAHDDYLKAEDLP